jgi:WD40 repeat protein/serine/threonine protein kinase
MNGAPKAVGNDLLRAHDTRGQSGVQPVGDPSLAGFLTALLTERPGDTIGRYRLGEKIGEGGCGVVYMAEQEEPVRRKVALKIIKLGMDTEQLIARFEAERQALALMDHTNIAKVLDAGATLAGRPYFVMELVNGIKITDYCDQNQLSTRQRLDLFIEVCRAIQHAHQKGVIHRDIKPSNVLVATQDGVPVPKVIDFGIAKATQGRLADQTVFTAFEQFLGTPAYMSPEQAQLGGMDVDTRSDIYSLGVLLYELLTSKTPFDAKELLAEGLDAMRRTIREKEPPIPSTRLKEKLVAADPRRLKSAPSHDSAAGEENGASSRRLLHETIASVRGELDWIVMKCLEKDRARRYDTANGLARDIERHLHNEPVAAGPPGKFYRFQKLARRNRAAFAAIAAVGIVLVAGVVVSTWQSFRATNAQHEEERLRKQSELARGEEAAARRLAETNALEMQKLLCQTYVVSANSLVDHGDPAGGLIWLAEALKLAGKNKHAEATIRVNMGAVLNQLPVLKNIAILDLPEVGSGKGINNVAAATPVFLSVDGRRVAVITSGSSQGKISKSSIVLCDSLSGKRIGDVMVSDGSCQDLEFSSDGNLLAAAASDGTYIFDAKTAKLIKRLDAGAAMVKFTSDGQYVVCLGFTPNRFAYKDATVWNIATGQAIARLQPHGGLRFAVISPSGRYVFYQNESEAGEWGAYIWDSSQDHKLVLQTNPMPIDSAEFSPNEKWIVCSFFNSQSVALIDPATGSVAKPPDGFPAHGFKVRRLLYSWTLADSFAAFTPDGSRLFLWGEDPSVESWDMTAWRPSGTKLNCAEPLLKITFSPDGRKAATLTVGYALTLWNVQTGQRLSGAVRIPHPAATAIPPGLAGNEFDMQFSPDGDSLILAIQGAVLTWRIEEKKPVLLAYLQRVSSLEFSADGTRVLSIDSTNGQASVFEAASGHEISRFTVLPGINQGRFSRDANTVLAETFPHPTSPRMRGLAEPEILVSLWDSAHGTPVATNLSFKFPAPDDPSRGLAVCFGYKPDSAGKAEFYSEGVTTNGDLFGPVWHKAAILPNLTFYKFYAPTGMVMGDPATGRVDTEQGKVEINDPLGPPIFATLSSDGALLLVERTNQTARAYTVSNGNPISPPLPVAARIIDAAFTPDHQKVVTLSADGTCECWDLVSGHPLGLLSVGNTGTSPSLEMTPDGLYFAIRTEFRTFSDSDGRVAWIRDFRIQQVGEVGHMKLIFEPSNTALLGFGATRSVDRQMNTARVFDSTTGRAITSLLVHEGSIDAATLSPDEHLVATASRDRTARVWDADTGTAVTPLLLHDAPVTALAFSLDRARFATGTSNGIVKIWALRPITNSVADLQILAQLYSGSRLGGQGGLEGIGTAQVHNLINAWRNKHSQGVSDGLASQTNLDTSLPPRAANAKSP